MSNYVRKTNTRTEKSLSQGARLLRLSETRGQKVVQQTRSRSKKSLSSTQPSGLLEKATQIIKTIIFEFWDKRSKTRRQYQKNRQVILAILVLAFLILSSSVSWAIQQSKVKSAVLKSEWSAPISKADYDKKVVEFFGVAKKEQTKSQVDPKHATTIVSRTLSQTKKAIVQTVSAKENTSIVGSQDEWLKSKNQEVVMIIKELWKDEARTALAVFQAESGLRPEAVGYNCYYGGKSKACKPEDRHLAWSVDCSVAQVNVKGKVCPAELMNPETNLKKAYEMYSRRGWQPWYAFSGGNYKKYL